MTAKELKEKARIYDDGYWQDGTHIFLPGELDVLLEQVCREQREICANQVSGWPMQCKLESEIEDDILRCEMPEL